MAQRDLQQWNRESKSQSGHRTGMLETKDYTLDSWARISLLAKNQEMIFNNLYSHINEENLLHVFCSIDGSKLVEIDNITKKQYAEKLKVTSKPRTIRCSRKMLNKSNGVLMLNKLNQLTEDPLDLIRRGGFCEEQAPSRKQE